MSIYKKLNQPLPGKPIPAMAAEKVFAPPEILAKSSSQEHQFIPDDVDSTDSDFYDIPEDTKPTKS